MRSQGASWSNDGWGISGATVFGYGVLSGHLLRWKGSDRFVRGVHLRGQADTHVVGPTLVDFPNHNLILVGTSDQPDKPNTVRHVKVFGWRTNSDGLHVWGHWNPITDLFLRTQDDSAYV